MSEDLYTLLRKGMAAADQGQTLVALLHLEDAAKLGSTPTLASYLGYCLARERRQFRKGIALCQEAIKVEPKQILHYLNLGRVYVEAGQKPLAIKAFRQGLRFGRNRQIAEHLAILGIRKPPVFGSLPRTHVLNRFAGKVLSSLGVR